MEGENENPDKILRLLCQWNEKQLLNSSCLGLYFHGLDRYIHNLMFSFDVNLAQNPLRLMKRETLLAVDFYD